MRISIVGHNGSGKSTLAKQISESMRIPYLHLDRLWFEEGGHLRPSTDIEGREQVHVRIQSRVEQFIAQHDAWVSDGFYPRVQPLLADQADTVVFLDIPLPRRIFNHLHRLVFQRKRHAEVSLWDDIKFIYQVVRRTFVQGPRMKEFLSANAGKVIYLRSYKEAEQYLQTLKGV